VSFRVLLLVDGWCEGRYPEVDGGSAEPALGVVALGSQEGQGYVDAYGLADPVLCLGACAAVEPLRLPPQYCVVV
jgi:hypothetical protein